MTTTVLSYQPNLGPNWQRGEYFNNPAYNRIELATLLIGGFAPSIALTVDVLDATLLLQLAGSPNDIVVYGHSVGAQVINKWLRDKGPTGVARGIDPARVSFVKGANPEHKYNGHDNAATGYNMYGPAGFPTGLPYKQIEFTRQYDFYGDYPNDTNNEMAWENVNGSPSSLYTPTIAPRGLPIGPGFINVHIDYTNVAIGDPSNTRWIDPADPNVTYVWSMTYPCPEINPTYTPDQKAQRDADIRPIIETGYARPAFIPPPQQQSVQVDFADMDAFKAKLKSSDDHTAMNAADMLAAVELAGPTKIQVTIYDKVYNVRGECNDYISLQAAYPRHIVETGMLTLKGDDPLAPAALLCHEEVVPITIEIGKMLWSGRIKVAKDRFGFTEEADTVVCELEGDRAWLMKIMAWPNFLLPIQVQFPPRGVAIGTAVSVIKWLVSTQSFRLQTGLYDVINNLGSGILDWETWIGTALMQDVLGPDGQFDLTDVMRMLRTPIYVIQGPLDFLFDTSTLISINWRMDKLYELIDQIVKDNGLVVEVKLWRPGDPQPDEGMPYPLTVPTICVDVKDMMGIVGPTHTFLDGILRTLIDLEHSVFAEILDPFTNPNGEIAPEGFNIAPIFGLNWVPPWAIFNADHPQSGCWGEMAHHHPLAWRTIIGGKSPKWMNDLMNAFFSWALDSLMIIVGIAGLPSNLLDGLFNDILLAFQLADNMSRRLKLGPYGYPEWFAPSGSPPYNIDAVFEIERQQWATRGYVSGIVNFTNGYPYEIGRDLFPGSLASIIRRGKVYTDFIENVVVTDDRKTCKVEVQIGDGIAEESTSVKTYRNVVKFQEALNIITLATGT